MTATATTVITALDTLLADILGSRLSAADKAKLTLYSGIVASLLDQALPAIDSKIDWAALEAGIAAMIDGIDATYKAIDAATSSSSSTETTTNG